MKAKNAIILVITAFIWGVAFVAQREGGDAVGAFTFNCVRSFIAGIVLIPAILIFDRMGICHAPKTAKDKKILYIGGISCGAALCIASNLQQVGITIGTAAGKAGFLTACYIVLVPILGLFLGRKCGINVWIGVVLTVIGLYLLCMEGSFGLQASDILLLMCALVFAIQIMIIDRFSPLADGVRMSCIQFFTVGILSAIPMIAFEMKPFTNGLSAWCASFSTAGAWTAILYAGVLSSGVAYTLQIIGQKGVNPAIASLIMSLESVFSVIAGWILLKEHLSLRALAGCLLIFAAVILAQLPFNEKIMTDD